jgi:pimeloyl-ACP methyl ester carboxylesterase
VSARARRAGAVAGSVIVALVVAAVVAARCVPAAWGAAALLHPSRRPVAAVPSVPFERVAFSGERGVPLVGWLFRARAARRGLVVYLHGVGSNKEDGIGVAARLGPLGWDVLAYDSRAHGESGGEECTYGFYEKRDVGHALDALGVTRAVVMGSSMGAAVALQVAAVDARVVAVIAQSPFSDLRTIVHERAPWLAQDWQVEAALHAAEETAAFRVDDVSPVGAAASIRAPVLILHGTLDRDIAPEHARRIFAALPGAKRLVMLEGAAHNDVLGRDDAWAAIDAWLAAVPTE